MSTRLGLFDSLSSDNQLAVLRFCGPDNGGDRRQLQLSIGPRTVALDKQAAEELIEAIQEVWEPVGYYQRVEMVVQRLKDLGAHVLVRRRKLAHREKEYLKIKADGGHHEWQTIVMPAIREHFPDAYLTSGGFLRSTSGHSGRMNLTIALEK